MFKNLKVCCLLQKTLRNVKNLFSVKIYFNLLLKIILYTTFLLTIFIMENNISIHFQLFLGDGGGVRGESHLSGTSPRDYLQREGFF